MNNANSGKEKNKNVEKENFNVPLDISSTPFNATPETAEEIVNAYGTYNIQPTADSDNYYPAIAQSETKNMKNKPKKFFRGPRDPNPAAD